MSALCVFSLEVGLTSSLVSLLRSPCTLSEPHLLLDTRYYSAQVRILSASAESDLDALLQDAEAVIVVPQRNNAELRTLSGKYLGEDSIRLLVSAKATSAALLDPIVPYNTFT